MRILTWLTVIYAGVLVLALAAALTTVCMLLWRISFTLSDVRRAIAAVADATEPLRRQLGPVEEAAAGAADSIGAARDALARGVEHVEARAGRLAGSSR